MGTFNKNKKSNIISDAKTYEGGAGVSQSTHDELTLLTLTTFLTDSFYEKADAKLNRLVSLVEKSDPNFVENLAVVARNDFNMRSTPVALLASNVIHTGISSREETIKHVFLRGDEITEFAGAVKALTNKKVLTNQAKVTLRLALNELNEKKALKYKGGKGREIRLSDVIRLVHPEPKNPKQSALFKFIVNEQKEGSVQKAWDKLSDGEKSRLKLIEKAVNGDDAGSVSWERTLSAAGPDGKSEAWNKVVPQMGYMALLRNLNNFLINIPESDTETWDYIVSKLRDRASVRQSKQLPFRFFSAWRELNLKAVKNRHRSRLISAIQEALDYSIDNMPKLDGSTVVISDISSSMTSYKISENSDITVADIGLLMGILSAKAYNADFVMFHSQSMKYKVDPSLPTLEIFSDIIRTVRWGGATVLNSVLTSVDLKSYDNVLIFSDMQIADDYSAQDFFGRVTSRSKVYSINLAGYKNTAFAVHPSKRNVYTISGWSDQTLMLIGSLGKGGLTKFINDRAKEIMSKTKD